MKTSSVNSNISRFLFHIISSGTFTQNLNLGCPNADQLLNTCGAARCGLVSSYDDSQVLFPYHSYTCRGTWCVNERIPLPPSIPSTTLLLSNLSRCELRNRICLISHHHHYHYHYYHHQYHHHFSTCDQKRICIMIPFPREWEK